jgi:hypothetical protein
VADGEGEHDLGEAPEQRQEAHPEQDQVGPQGLLNLPVCLCFNPSACRRWTAQSRFKRVDADDPLALPLPSHAWRWCWCRRFNGSMPRAGSCRPGLEEHAGWPVRAQDPLCGGSGRCISDRECTKALERFTRCKADPRDRDWVKERRVGSTSPRRVGAGAVDARTQRGHPRERRG